MSDYPSIPSYPQVYEARDQQNPLYLPHTYPNPYLQADDSQHGQMASHYGHSMSAYGYNRSIPSFSASAIAAGVPPLPIFQGWNQDSVPLPPYVTPNNGSQYSGSINSAQHSIPYYPPPSQPTYQQQMPVVEPLNRGELDAGEFEDRSNATHTASNGYGSSQSRVDSGTGYVDTAQRALYSKVRDYSPQQSAYPANNSNYPPRDPSQNRRQNSGSFSPYLPSVATDRDGQSRAEHHNTHAPSRTPKSINGQPQSQQAWSQNGASSSSRTNTQTTSQKTDDAGQQPVDPLQPASHKISSATNGKSVTDSRKKAQAAILNLWPYDVRYQTYVDEGFNKELVGSLFDELKMTRNSVKSANEAGNSVGTNAKHQRGQENIPPGMSNSTLVGGLTSNKTSSNGIDKRRVSTSSMGTNPSSSLKDSGNQKRPSTSAVALPAQPAAKTEKEKTLQSKMEALRKSREERAQKAAAKNINKLPSAGGDVIIPKANQAAASLSHPSTSTAPPSPLVPSRDSAPNEQPQVNNNNINKSSTSSSVAATPHIQQQASVIPGLFLASASASTSTNLPSTMPPSSHSNIRKRPVAADFDESTPISSSFKRPFGHNRTDQRLIIQVSDDEDDSENEDVAMDLESQATQDSPIQPSRNMSDQRPAATQNLPPLSNFPTRKPSTRPGNPSAADISTAQGAPNTAGRLTRVQSEMEKLKKEIAMREARQRAKQASSGSRTPKASEVHGLNSNVATSPPASIASKIETSIKMQEMIETATTNITLDQQRLADAQAAEVKKAADIKKSEDEQKRLRIEEIAADIPRVDAEVQQNQSKLEQLRDEMARIEVDFQKGLQEKLLLAEEMKRLGDEAEEQLQAKKDRLNDLTKNDRTGSDDSSRSTSYGLVTESSELAQLGPSPALITATVPQPPSPVDVEAGSQASGVNDKHLGIEVAATPPVNGNDATPDNDNSTSSPVEKTHSEHLALSEVKEPGVPKETTSTDQALEAAFQDAVRAEADLHGQEDEDMDNEDLCASDPGQLARQKPTHAPQEARSPAYSPALARTVPDVPQQGSDGYEPPGATPPPVNERFAPDSPPFSSAPQEAADNENLHVDKPEFEPAPAANDVDQGCSEGNLLSANSSVSKLDEDRTTEATDKLGSFIPYESPLKRFRAYRFHPNFKQDISGGLRSKTYSNKIDIMKEFCRFELAGGICNDSTCDSQHFRDIDLPDDAILTALGSPEEFKGEQRDRFCTGLRGVLMDLRVRKIRDFEVIASEIMAHRANFLGDKSKVLASLEGTTI